MAILEDQAISNQPVFAHTANPGSPYAIAKQRGYPLTDTHAATVKYFQDAEPVSRVFNPQQYLTDMTQFEASMQGDRKKLRRVATALKLMNPSFNPQSYLANWETQARNAMTRKYELLEDVDKSAVDQQIEMVMQQLKPRTVEEFEKVWDTLGVYNSDTRKKHFDLWRQFNPEVDPSKQFLPSGALSAKGIQDTEDRYYGRTKKLVDAGYEWKRKANLVMSALAKGTGISDIAAINSFQKMIDEGVVRSDDIALIGSAESYWGQIMRWAKYAKEGDKLTDKARANIALIARDFFREGNGLVETRLEGWKNVVDAQDQLDWNRIVPRETYEELKAEVQMPKLPGFGKGGRHEPIEVESETEALSNPIYRNTYVKLPDGTELYVDYVPSEPIEKEEEKSQAQ